MLINSSIIKIEFAKLQTQLHCTVEPERVSVCMETAMLWGGTTLHVRMDASHSPTCLYCIKES